MSRGKIYTICTGLFYAVFVPILVIADPNKGNGQCNPGIGFLLYMLLLLLSGVAFLISVVCRIFGLRAWMGPMIVNGLVFLACIGFMFTS